MELHGNLFLSHSTELCSKEAVILLKLKMYGNNHYFILYYSRVFPYSLVEWIWHLFFNDKV